MTKLLKRKIDVEVTLGRGDFGESGADRVRLSGLRVIATVTKGGLPSLDSATIRIFGATPTFMNQVTRLGRPLDYLRDNTVTLFAGDDEGGMSQVFTGVIMSANTDLNRAPESSIDLFASAGALALVRPVDPISFNGGADIAVIAAQIAASMGKGFVNHGVTGRLNSPYLAGSAMDQLRALVQTGNIEADVNGGPTGEVLEIWPKGTAKGAMGPLISKDTGLVGYPQYSDVGIAVSCIFNPGIIFGQRFQLKTDIEPANGAWTVLNLSYELESETPGGRWFQRINAYREYAA